MIITRATEYSIRAVLHLAERYPASVVSKQEICEAEGITPAFLTKILQPLIRSGMVRSKRGASGGFALAKDPARLTLLDVMRAVDEPISLNLCLLEGNPCDRSFLCPVHEMWVKARESLESIFGGRSVADIVKERRERMRAAGRSPSPV
jgi:Rrf2 family protein